MGNRVSFGNQVSIKQEQIIQLPTIEWTDGYIKAIGDRAYKMDEITEEDAKNRIKIQNDLHNVIGNAILYKTIQGPVYLGHVTDSKHDDEGYLVPLGKVKIN